VMILVQRRGPPVLGRSSASSRSATSTWPAPTAQARAELAVRDVEAVLRFLALPRGLPVARLRAESSPLFGWSERELYRLAQPRPEGRRCGRRSAPPALEALTSSRTCAHRPTSCAPTSSSTACCCATTAAAGSSRAWARGRGRHRRLPGPGARLRGRGRALAHRLPRMARPGRGRGQAPDGRGGRPHPRDDRARRQGASRRPSSSCPTAPPARRRRPRAPARAGRAASSGPAPRTTCPASLRERKERSSPPRSRSAGASSTSP
jgi:hypothetical protein